MIIDKYPYVEFLNFKDETSIEDFLNAPVFKNVSLENALQTLKTKSFWFSNPAKWEDPFESRFINAKYGKAEKEFPFKEMVFCTCVTSRNVSEAHWNIYSRGEIGIQFRIRTNNFIQTLNEYVKKHPKYKVFIGRVEYHNTLEISEDKLGAIVFNEKGIIRDINSKEFGAHLLLLKRNAFVADEEIRIIVYRDRKHPNVGGFSIPYSFDNNQLFEKVKISPKVGKNTTELLIKALQESPYLMCPINKGDRTIVEKCHLFDKASTKTHIIV